MISRASVSVLTVTTFFLSLLAPSILAFDSSPVAKLAMGWDPSADPSVVGYRLYQGGASQLYTNVMDLGNVTTTVVSGLAPGATYFFAITAYDGTGLESTFSGELSYTVPLNAAFSSVTEGPLGQVVLTGTGPAGAVYEIWSSQDFTSWLLVGSVTINYAGLFQYTDPISAVLLRRFYRLKQSKTGP